MNLTPEQEKNWAGFNSAMHYLGHNGADRLNLRIARAKRDPPDDIIEQMRNEAQFLNDRAVDQRNVADAAEPLFASLDDKQKSDLHPGNGQSEPRARAGLTRRFRRVFLPQCVGLPPIGARTAPASIENERAPRE